MDIYSYADKIPLTYSRQINGINQTGLTVTVMVVNAMTGATLLASTNLTETVSGNGIYNYNWTHGLTTDTECEVNYTNGTRKISELILITDDGTGGRAS